MHEQLLMQPIAPGSSHPNINMWCKKETACVSGNASLQKDPSRVMMQQACYASANTHLSQTQRLCHLKPCCKYRDTLLDHGTALVFISTSFDDGSNQTERSFAHIAVDVTLSSGACTREELCSDVSCVNERSPNGSYQDFARQDSSFQGLRSVHQHKQKKRKQVQGDW